MTLVLGIVAGSLIAVVQLGMTRRAAERARVHRSRLQVLLGMPVRVGGAALVFLLIAKLSPWALLGALAAFQIGRGLLLSCLHRSEA